MRLPVGWNFSSGARESLPSRGNEEAWTLSTEVRAKSCSLRRGFIGGSSSSGRWRRICTCSRVPTGRKKERRKRTRRRRRKRKRWRSGLYRARTDIGGIAIALSRRWWSSTPAWVCFFYAFIIEIIFTEREEDRRYVDFSDRTSFFFPRMFAGRYAPVRRLLRIADLWKRGSNAVDFGLFLERLSALIRSDEGIIWFGTWAYCIVSLRVSRSCNYRVICNFSLFLYQRSKSFKSFGKIINILMRRIHRRWVVNLFGNHFHKYETNSMNFISWQII